MSTTPPVSFIARQLPLIATLREHGRGDVRGDLTAGLTTAVMLVPQGMAYAMLAGLPPIVGLYASTVPLLLYALFGTSRQLAVGPVAMVSLLVAAGVGGLAPQGSPEYLALAILLAAMVGAIQLAMGLGRLGFLVNFLSHPVVSGFTSAAALIIGLSQLKHLLGLQIPRSHHVHEILLGAGRQLGQVQPITLAIGAGAVALLLLLKRWRPTFPGALAVVLTYLLCRVVIQRRWVPLAGALALAASPTFWSQAIIAEVYTCGIVVMLDPRLRSKPYGRLFLESLPECELVEESAGFDPLEVE